jgi:hypothetical protein
MAKKKANHKPMNFVRAETLLGQSEYEELKAAPEDVIERLVKKYPGLAIQIPKTTAAMQINAARLHGCVLFETETHDLKFDAEFVFPGFTVWKHHCAKAFMEYEDLGLDLKELVMVEFASEWKRFADLSAYGVEIDAGTRELLRTSEYDKVKTLIDEWLIIKKNGAPESLPLPADILEAV